MTGTSDLQTVRLSSSGVLYIVSTPIGNLEDLSLRAIRVLGGVQAVAAEDTRRTRRLLAHLQIKTRLISCHGHNERESTRRILDILERGRDVALVSDAGTPVLSDPGTGMVKKAREAGIPIVPVPGPSAITTALSIAALPADSFLFAGFLPARQSARKKVLRDMVRLPYTMVFFEAPHRLHAALADIRSVLGDRNAVLCRELTKVHETVLAGSLSEITEKLGGGPVRGEITLVIEGCGEIEPKESVMESDFLKRVMACMVSEKNVSVREVSVLLNQLTGISRTGLYSLALKVREGRTGQRPDETRSL